MPARYATISEAWQRKGRWRASLIALTCCLALFGCGGPSPWPDATRTSPPAIPTYPNIRPGTLEETSASRQGTRTTFLTSDTNQAVQAFYRTELRRTGWDQDVGDDTAAFTRFVERKACPVYALSVKTERQDPQTLKVTVAYSPEVCRGG